MSLIYIGHYIPGLCLCGDLGKVFHKCNKQDRSVPIIGTTRQSNSWTSDHVASILTNYTAETPTTRYGLLGTRLAQQLDFSGCLIAFICAQPLTANPKIKLICTMRMSDDVMHLMNMEFFLNYRKPKQFLKNLIKAYMGKMFFLHFATISS